MGGKLSFVFHSFLSDQVVNPEYKGSCFYSGQIPISFHDFFAAGWVFSFRHFDVRLTKLGLTPRSRIKPGINLKTFMGEPFCVFVHVVRIFFSDM